MILKMEAIFTCEEVQQLCKQEFLRRFGPAPDGYELEAGYSYFDVTVRAVKKRDEAPVAPVETDAEPEIALPTSADPEPDLATDVETPEGISDTNSAG